MQCENYGCTNQPAAGFPCCDGNCGWEHKRNAFQYLSFTKGQIQRDQLRNGALGLDPWTDDQVLYYKRLKEGKK